MKKPRRDHIPKKRPQPRRRRHKNPAASIPPKTPGVFGDPIFLHHLAAGILRYLELMHPQMIAGIGDYDKAAKFITPLEFPTCKYCGTTRDTSYEASMGMFCEASPDLLHTFGSYPPPEAKS